MTVFKKLDATAHIARALYNLGEYRRRTFDLTKAMSYFHMAEAIAEKGGDKSLLTSVANGIGSVSFARGDLRVAAKYFRRALALARETGDRYGEAAVQVNLGEAAYRDGKLKEALRDFKSALEVATSLGSSPVTASALSRLGMVTLFDDDLRIALDYFERARGIACEGGHRRLEAEARCGLTRAQWRRADGRCQSILNCIMNILNWLCWLRCDHCALHARGQFKLNYCFAVGNFIFG